MISSLQAIWGVHVFRVSENSILPLSDGIHFASELDYDELNTTEAQNPLNIKGGDRQKHFSLLSPCSVHLGNLNPLIEYNQWQRDLGKSLPFLLGGLPFGAWRMILVNVRMENTQWVEGNIISADLILDFQEDMPATVQAKDVESAIKKKGIKKGEKKSKFAEIDALLKS